jgi:small subunit ribosomal protein S1
MEGLEKDVQMEQHEDEPEAMAQNLDESDETPTSEPPEAEEAHTGEEKSESDEVIQTEEGAQAQQTGEDSDDTLAEMYEESIRRVQEGEVVQGRIIQADKDFVLVDIGYKSEGQVPIEEFTGPDGALEVTVGDTVDVMVERWEEENGAVRLSKEKASRMIVWVDIKKAYDENGIVEGAVTSRVKGGLSVDIGVPAFLPGSQVDLRPVRDLDQLVGKTFKFKVLKYNKKRSNVVLSRRVILEKEREAQRAETLATIHEGKVMDGVVKNITEYGVFVDLGGIDGLLHITDMSWGRISHPSELFSVGDEITVKALSLDLERERVSLGLKQLAPDPWEAAEEQHPIGSHVVGKIVSLTDYGAFVELEKGVEGLIHVSEMSWTRKIRHPSQLISVGETVEAVVLNVSADKRRISLGMKQVVPNPWDVISEKYPVGTTIEGKIKNITDFGLFIGIDEGIDGLVHISDMSWTKRIKHPSEIYKKGDEVRAIVLNIDKENERFSLGVKQLEKDPWETIPDRYEIGSRITGTVTNVTDFGVFVELEEGIEGLVHVSEVSREKIKTPVGRFQIGNILSAKVLNVNPKERRIGLSVKQLEVDEEHDLVSDYLDSYTGPPSSLGELLKEKTANQASTQETPEEPAEKAEEPEEQGQQGEEEQLEDADQQTSEESDEKVGEPEEEGQEAEETQGEEVSASDAETISHEAVTEADKQTEAEASAEEEEASSGEADEAAESAAQETVDVEPEESAPDSQPDELQ